MLAAYLDAVTRKHHDCCTFMADWLIENGLPDPMADRRGTYSTPREYMRLIKREGGLLASCNKRLQRIGLHETSAPRAGDVAIVLGPVAVRRGRAEFGPTCAICVSDAMRAVVSLDVALAIAQLQTIKAWTFHG